jgi:hypothetical protein
MSYRSAWTTITGKVFVSDDDILELLRSTHGDRPEVDDLGIDAYTYEEAKIAFEVLADQKIKDLFPTDDPVKFNEAEIDMDSYKC